ncbi:MAG: MotA/TolQ/ExbB proton channel family protein [Deltaproteobacteria bacterium]|nr:MotA/TolQ/ExbB proton channel family protein [Deltaproteobacteria bacterium]
MNVVAKSKTLMLAMGAAPVMWLMIALSIVSLAIVLERLWFFRAIDDDLESLADALSRKLRAGDLQGARGVLEASPSAEAAVVVAGVIEAPNGVAAAREAIAGAMAIQRMKLERRLAFLGTLGNNAPFLGLFGTVVGIVMAFERLGQAGTTAGAPAEVMASIAEALVATAIGLAVAIPAVAAFNWFQRKIKSIAGRTDALSRVLLAHLEGDRA